MIVVSGIISKRPAKVCLAKDKRVIKTLPADGAYDPLNISILPRRSVSCWAVSDTHRV